jgi:hypothetical protein
MHKVCVTSGIIVDDWLTVCTDVIGRPLAISSQAALMSTNAITIFVIFY